MGLALEIFEVGFGDHVVQVGHAVLGSGEQHDMPGVSQGVAGGHVVQVAELFRALALSLLDHPGQAMGGGGGVVHGAVGVL